MCSISQYTCNCSKYYITSMMVFLKHLSIHLWTSKIRINHQLFGLFFPKKTNCFFQLEENLLGQGTRRAEREQGTETKTPSLRFLFTLFSRRVIAWNPSLFLLSCRSCTQRREWWSFWQCQLEAMSCTGCKQLSNTLGSELEERFLSVGILKEHCY